MEYYVDHRGNQFYIITNADGKNYKVHKDFVFVTSYSFIITGNWFGFRLGGDSCLWSSDTKKWKILSDPSPIMKLARRGEGGGVFPTERRMSPNEIFSVLASCTQSYDWQYLLLDQFVELDKRTLLVAHVSLVNSHDEMHLQNETELF